MVASSNAAAGREFIITRAFDAPRELGWKAWTESERLGQWWGPKGFEMRVAGLDLRPGGIFHYSMRSPDGMEQGWSQMLDRLSETLANAMKGQSL